MPLLLQRKGEGATDPCSFTGLVACYRTSRYLARLAEREAALRSTIAWKPFWSWTARAALVVTLPGVLVAAFLPVGVAPVIGGSDWASHGAAFAVLAVLTFVAFPRVPLILSWAILALVGAGIEVVQAIPALGRGASLLEAAYDALVVAIVFGLIRLMGFGRVTGAHVERESANGVD